jgi:hypothetical protein
MKPRFKMTYEVVTGESARRGDFAHHGYLPRSGEAPLYRTHMPKRPALFTLRQVIDLLVFRGSGPCEADSCPVNVPRWVTCQITTNESDRCVSLSVHLDDVSPASARRVARLLNCYGLTK